MSEYTLPTLFKNRVQGIVGELVALDYVLDQLLLELGDKVIISTRDFESGGSIRKGAKVFRRKENPFHFIENELLSYYLSIGSDCIDLASANDNVKTLFDQYNSKTKAQLLEDIKHLFIEYEEYDKEERERIKSWKDGEENRWDENKKKLLKACNELSPQDIAKALAIVELDNRAKTKKLEKGKYPLDRPHSIFSLSTYLEVFYIRRGVCVNTFKLPKMSELVRNISEYVNTKYEELNILSSLYQSILRTNTRLDAVIVHNSGNGTLKKLIIIESKTSPKPTLTKNQKAFASSLRDMNSDKVEYKILHVNFKMSNSLKVSEIQNTKL